MPKEIERALRKRARRKGMKGERADAYVYGTMRQTGWKPSHQKRRGKPRSARKSGGR